MRIIDLTHPIIDGMPVYFPWHPATEWVQTANYKEHNCVVHRLTIGTHSGTHIDAPSHIFEGMHHIDAYDLSFWYSEAQVLDFTHRDKCEAITGAEMAEKDVEEGIGVIIKTGWDMYFGREDYYKSYPALSKEAGEILIRKNVKYLGADTPFNMEIHKMFLSRGKPLITNLKNLDEIHRRRVRLIAAPLLLKDGDGSPARVFAIED
ncbi:MAG: cyclase family protein [Bacteroidota bacterium]